MKRLFIILSIYLISIIPCWGQAPQKVASAKVKDLVETFNTGDIFCTTAVFVKVLDSPNVLFSVEDDDFIIPVRLLKNDLGAEKRFLALNLHPRDTLTIKGRLSYISIDHEHYKGLNEASILEVRRSDKAITQPDVEPARSTDKKSFQLVEKKPSFNGGDANEFSKWVNKNLNYPKEAKEGAIRGRVTVAFTVKADGSVSDVHVLRGVEKSLDDEAVRVVSSSPRWTPGQANGKPVDVTYSFPIIFSCD